MFHFGNAPACRWTAAAPADATGWESATFSRRPAPALGCTQVRNCAPFYSCHRLRSMPIFVEVPSTECRRYPYFHAPPIPCSATQASLSLAGTASGFFWRRFVLSRVITYPVYRGVLVTLFWRCSLPFYSSHHQHTTQNQKRQSTNPSPLFFVCLASPRHRLFLC